MWQACRIASPFRRAGRPVRGSTHVEIYVPEQVLIVFKDDAPELIAHISTGVQNPDGTPKKWCEILDIDTDANGEPLPEPVTKEECADAKTPGGVFRFTRRYEGKRVGPLGGMMNPVYFNYGIAVHGADNVPLEPASHGCVRLNQAIAKVFPSMVAKARPGLRVGSGRQAARAVQPDRQPAVVQLRQPRCNDDDHRPLRPPPPSLRPRVPAPTTTVKSTTTTPAATTTVPPTTVGVTTTSSASFG